MIPLILDTEGPVITEEEKALFNATQPAGFILFQRHCETPEQLNALVADLKASVAHDNPLILVDQEGGRVARLKPPHWNSYPPASEFCASAETNVEAAQAKLYAMVAALAHELCTHGINVNCAPVADLAVEGAHSVIGDRAYGSTPEMVAALAGTYAQALIDQRVMPIIKHIPGHGRATVDSHHALPQIDTDLDTLEAQDFAVFKALNHLPAAMTAHIIYSALDPEQPVTHSKKAIDYIREHIGFEGLIVSDDLEMKALQGDAASKACKVIEAGCDIALLCNASFEDRKAASQALQPIQKEASRRIEQAYATLKQSAPARMQA